LSALPLVPAAPEVAALEPTEQARRTAQAAAVEREAASKAHQTAEGDILSTEVFPQMGAVAATLPNRALKVKTAP
jgi:predicted RNase H-like nuclease